MMNTSTSSTADAQRERFQIESSPLPPPKASGAEDGGDDLPTNTHVLWSPSGVWWKDLLHFAGPGWLVSIAYVDPGNYQADIQAGSLSRYSLLCIIWWTSILSLYVQILCVRLSHYGGLTLAEASARYSSSNRMRYLNWAIAEFSTVITDLPEVIGIGIACNIFFGWPYWVGVLLSLGTTMLFLMTLNYGMRVLEVIIALFVGIMGVALFVEMEDVGVNTNDLLRGWAVGFADLESGDLFAVLGVVGAVVMPHNLYLHTAACRSRAVTVPTEHARKAVFWSSIEPILPVLISFFINLAVVAIAAESVYGLDNGVDVGLTDFCTYFQKLAGCALWGIALLAAGQSSAITTTYTGQYVMDGFLNLQLPIKTRAVLTRLVAITPCVVVSVLFPKKLNQMVNVVNALLSFLLPFAFTPLVKFNCHEVVMGEFASSGFEKFILHFFAFAVWFVNAVGLSAEGGGFFGDWKTRYRENDGEEDGGGGREGAKRLQWLLLLGLEIGVQIFYAWWNWSCIRQDIGREIISLSSGNHAVLTNDAEHDDDSEERSSELGRIGSADSEESSNGNMTDLEEREII